MQFHKHVLSNGLTIVGETIPTARAVGIGFWVRTGARDETPEISGVSHFLEHMVFKGTERRDALRVNRDLDRIDADPNAFTSEENTVFYGSVLPEYVEHLVDVLSDILRPSLRGDDFDTEKKVILEEIGMYEDQPSRLVFDFARKAFFGEHRLGNSVLGSVASIQALSREQMVEYFGRRYGASNIVVAVAGCCDWQQIVDLIQQKCGDWAPGERGREQIREVKGTGDFKIEHRESVTQEHVLLISQGPAADSPLRYAAALLADAIGDTPGGRLYWELVDPGLAESAGCDLDGNEGTGAIYTSFTAEPDQTQDNLAIVHRVLAEVQKKGITREELHQARTKRLSRLVRGSERSFNRMFKVGAMWVYLGRYCSLDEEIADYEAVTLEHIREYLDRYPLPRVTTLALGPLQTLQQPA